MPPPHSPTPPTGFGPPPPAFAPLPAPGGGRKRRRAGRAGWAALAVVLVVAALAGGGRLLYGPASEEDTAARPAHRAHPELAWVRRAEAADTTAPTPGTWFTGSTVVKAQPRRLAAYALDSGEDRWSIPLHHRVCGTSIEAVGGRAAVQHGVECRELTVVDLAEGDILWSLRLPAAPDHDPSWWHDGEVALTRTTVAVASSSAAAVYRIGDRTRLYGADARSASCYPVGVRGGARLLARVRCGGVTASQVWSFAPGTGRPTREWTAPGGFDVRALLSTRPAVAALATGSSEHGVDHLLRLPEDGGTPVTVDMKRQSEHLCADAGPLCSNIVVAGDTVYLPGITHDSYGDANTLVNEVIAYDLGTGKAKWAGEPEDKRQLAPVGVLDGDLIAYQPATGEKGGALLRFDGRTGKRAVYERHAAETGEQEREAASHAVPLLYRGMFFLAAQEIGERGPGEPAKPLLAAFR